MECIYKEINRLYGKEIAEDAFKDLSQNPIVESGTHLGFPRDIDNFDAEKNGKPSLRSLLNQNMLISASFMKELGHKYHVGLYGSNVLLNHSF